MARRATSWRCPPRSETAVPFGANIGGVNPAFVSIKPDAAFDSWLSVGPTDGSAGGKISSIGVDFRRLCVELPTLPQHALTSNEELFS
jgi:hypothetical protein